MFSPPGLPLSGYCKLAGIAVFSVWVGFCSLSATLVKSAPTGWARISWLVPLGVRDGFAHCRWMLSSSGVVPAVSAFLEKANFCLAYRPL